MASDSLPPEDPHVRPDGVSDDAVYALGRVSEALETVERARGALYEFHQLIGGADAKLDDAIEALNRDGHEELAQTISRDLVGRNVIDGRWTFQIVEEFDDGYYSFFRHLEHNLRVRLADGKRHIFESEMKERRRTAGHPHHSARP